MTLLVFLALLSFLVLIHEAGHFISAKFFRVKVEEFGIGIPPKVLTLFKKDGTEYSLNLLPLGGFVRLLGEDMDKSQIVNNKLQTNSKFEGQKFSKQGYFFAKAWWKRVVILTAGVVGNFVLGILLFSIVYSVMGVPEVEKERVVVSGVSQGSPAQLAGIESGDVMIKLEEEEIKNADLFIEKIRGRKGEMVRLTVGKIGPEGRLKDERRQVSLIPREDPPEGEGPLGVVVGDFAEVRYEKKPWYVAPFYGVVNGVQEAFLWGLSVFYGVVRMISGLVAGRVPQQLTGPVGIYQRTGEVVGLGWLAVVRFGAILSVNLGVVNLLPIPGLDGGRLVFVGLQKMFGKKEISKVENWAHTLGFVLLIGILVLVTWQDIMRLVAGG